MRIITGGKTPRMLGLALALLLALAWSAAAGGCGVSAPPSVMKKRPCPRSKRIPCTFDRNANKFYRL